MSIPKLFISYSWSNPQHEQWVLDLATELRDSEVDVILDKWDLKEGHDAIAFMEKMVTDPEIKKVLIISDNSYTKKADDRRAGVGTETQIISAKIYEEQEQDKFVAVVAEKDDDGKPFLPTYYKSRIYIDLSGPDNYVENFEKLLRWIFDKPLYKRPPLGNKPSFLDEVDPISLGTSAIYKKTIDAIKNNKENADGFLDEYLNLFSDNLEKFRISEIDDNYEDIIKNIEKFIPYRNEAIKMFITIAQHRSNDDTINSLHRFFESLIPYMNRPEEVYQWNEIEFDNFRFIIHELFLYMVCILIKYEKFEHINTLLEQEYYYLDDNRNSMHGFPILNDYMNSLDNRKRKLGLNKVSLRADLLKERNSRTGIHYRYLIQADFVLYIRADFKRLFSGWTPYTLVNQSSNTPLEVFARAKSKRYFEKMKRIIGINSKDELEELLKKYNQGRPLWGNYSYSPSILIGFNQLATVE